MSAAHRAAVGALLAATCGLAIAACGGKSAAAADSGCRTIIKKAGAPTTGAPTWPYPNAEITNNRVATGSSITAANVSGLREAWSFKLSGPAAKGIKPYGSLTANPVVENGLVYFQDLDSNVYALSLSTGALRWEYLCNEPEKSGPGPNGVAVSDGRVYGLTPTTAFALSATTGHRVWMKSDLLHKGQGTFGIQPEVASGRVYLASQYGSGPGGGVLMALSAATGAVLWRFNTVTGPEPGVAQLGLGSGGAWETPLVGSDGSVTFGIGNPYQTPTAALAHPAKLLYTDSDVNLDAATGKLRWYYQAVPNDFKDYDMQTSPIAVTSGETKAVIGSGKMGYVYEMNAETGKLIWKTPVGEHNSHDDDSLLALEHRSSIKPPLTILPGSFGGVLTDLAAANGAVYVATLDLPLTYVSFDLPTPTKAAGAPTGEIEALSLATGRREWDTKVPELPLGAVTVANDLLFTTLYNGVLIAIDRQTGAIVFRHQLPTSTNSPIAIVGDTVIVPAGGPEVSHGGGDPQIVAYRLP